MKETKVYERFLNVEYQWNDEVSYTEVLILPRCSGFSLMSNIITPLFPCLFQGQNLYLFEFVSFSEWNTIIIVSGKRSASYHRATFARKSI